MEITERGNFVWGGELVSLGTGGARKGLLGQKRAGEVYKSVEGAKLNIQETKVVPQRVRRRQEI